MKKLLFPSLMLAALTIGLFVSCGDDKDGDSGSALSPAEYADQYFSVDKGTFRSGAMPESTTNEVISGITMNESALAGGSNFITINTDQAYERFYIGIEGRDGYVEYIPTSQATRATPTYSYNIPVSYGANLSESIVMTIKGLTSEGEVTQAYRQTIKFVESKDGELTINLTFNRDKDLDLHLVTPSGNHISWEQRTWSVTTEDGRVITFGLDHDSNAACDIDHLNNENIVIPEEAIEGGDYLVILEMFENCDKRIGTDMDWKVSVRYKGNYVTNTLRQRTPGENSMAWTDGASTIEAGPSPYNPVWGRYPYNHAAGTQIHVLQFRVKNPTRGISPKMECIHVPTLKDIAKKLDKEEGIR